MTELTYTSVNIKKLIFITKKAPYQKKNLWWYWTRYTEKIFLKSVERWGIKILKNMHLQLNPMPPAKSKIWFRSNHQRCSVKKRVLKNFANVTVKHLSLSLFLINLKYIYERLLLMVYYRGLARTFVNI